MSMSMIRIGLVCCCLTRSEEHTSKLQSPNNLVCRLLLEKKTIAAKPLFDRRCAFEPLPGTAHSVQRDVVCSDHRPFHGRRVIAIVAHHHHLFFFNVAAPTEIYTLSLHDALPI